MENTDHPFVKQKNNIEATSHDERDHAKKKIENTSQHESDEINKTVAYFKINDNLTINNLILPRDEPQEHNPSNIIDIDDPPSADTTEQFRWSLDISYIQNDDRYSIF